MFFNDGAVVARGINHLCDLFYSQTFKNLLRRPSVKTHVCLLRPSRTMTEVKSVSAWPLGFKKHFDILTVKSVAHTVHCVPHPAFARSCNQRLARSFKMSLESEICSHILVPNRWFCPSRMSYCGNADLEIILQVRFIGQAEQRWLCCSGSIVAPNLQVSATFFGVYLWLGPCCTCHPEGLFFIFICPSHAFWSELVPPDDSLMKIWEGWSFSVCQQ